MPINLIVHAVDCPTKRRPCTCDAQEFTDLQEASVAYRGDSDRLEVGKVIPPPLRLPALVAQQSSQAKRHTREISN